MEMTENEAIKELHKIRPIGGIIPQKRAEAIDLAINSLEKQEKIKEAFEMWEAETGGYYGADDETTRFISTLNQILRSDVVRVDAENMDSIKDKIEELLRYAENQYKKAIDDLMEKASECFISDADWNYLVQEAEQLKAGGNDEQKRQNN